MRWRHWLLLSLMLLPTLVLGQGQDRNPPRVTITSPTTATTYTTTATSLTVEGTVRDNKDVVQVTWATDQDTSGLAQGIDAWTFMLLLTVGTTQLTVTAVDGAGNQGTATLTIIVLGTPPPPRTVTLAWNDSNTQGDAFLMERCTGRACTTMTPVATISFTARTWTDTTVDATSTYCYQLAVTLAGETGPWSNLACTP
jgi:hypothetical protein